MRGGGQALTFLVAKRDDSTIQGVVKRLRYNSNAKARARMRREVKALEVLQTQTGHVPRLLEDNTHLFDSPNNEQLYLITEFAPGETLEAVVRRSERLGVELSTAVALALLEVVGVAHDNDTYHRDIKPDNIILRNIAPPDLVLIDFGLSFNESDEPLTETNERLGSRFVAPPEFHSHEGNRKDPRTDLTCVCAVYYFCLTGQYVGQLTGEDGLMPHLRPPYAIRAALGNDDRVAPLEAFFSRAFSHQIANRFQSAEEIQDRLTGAVVASADTELEPLEDVFARTAESIFRVDRAMQIQAMRETMVRIHQGVNVYVSGVRIPEQFNIYFENSDDKRIVGDDFGGYEKIDGSFRLNLRLRSKEGIVGIVFSAWARGLQFCVTRRIIWFGPSPPDFEVLEAAKEVAWFDISLSPDSKSVERSLHDGLIKGLGILRSRFGG